MPFRVIGVPFSEPCTSTFAFEFFAVEKPVMLPSILLAVMLNTGETELSVKRTRPPLRTTLLMVIAGRSAVGEENLAFLPVFLAGFSAGLEAGAAFPPGSAKEARLIAPFFALTIVTLGLDAVSELMLI